MNYYNRDKVFFNQGDLVRTKPWSDTLVIEKPYYDSCIDEEGIAYYLSNGQAYFADRLELVQKATPIKEEIEWV